MRFLVIGVGIVALLAVAVPGQAQQARGDNELQLQGTLFIATSSTQNDVGTVDVRFGRFVTDFQQVGIEATVSLIDHNKVAGLGGPFYRYNFSKDKVVPYLGASAAVGFGSGFAGKGGSISVDGGVRVFLDRRTAFTVSATTGYSFDQHEFGKNVQFLAGFSHLW